jgi:hypothetical protein
MAKIVTFIEFRENLLNSKTKDEFNRYVLSSLEFTNDTFNNHGFLLVDLLDRKNIYDNFGKNIGTRDVMALFDWYCELSIKMSLMKNILFVRGTQILGCNIDTKRRNFIIDEILKNPENKKYVKEIFFQLAYKGHYESLKYFFDNINNEDKLEAQRYKINAFWYAIRDNHIDVAQLMLDKKIITDIDHKDIYVTAYLELNRAFHIIFSEKSVEFLINFIIGNNNSVTKYYSDELIKSLAKHCCMNDYLLKMNKIIEISEFNLLFMRELCNLSVKRGSKKCALFFINDKKIIPVRKAIGTAKYRAKEKVDTKYKEMLTHIRI